MNGTAAEHWLEKLPEAFRKKERPGSCYEVLSASGSHPFNPRNPYSLPFSPGGFAQFEHDRY